MAANIENVRTGAREVPGGKHGRLTVEFTAHGVITREKGSPDRFGPVPWSAIHDLAMKRSVGMARTRR